MKLYTKITSFLLSLLVLFSTLSFTVEKHFCGGFLVDISYFGNATGCADEEGTDCDALEVIAKKKCCKDDIQKIDGQDELQKVSSQKLNSKKQPFAVTLIVSYTNLFSNLHQQIVPYKNYTPPNLVTDIQVLYEVFII